MIKKMIISSLIILMTLSIGGCREMEERIEKREARHEEIQQGMMKFMEDKYGEKFVGSSIEYGEEYTMEINGCIKDYGVVTPEIDSEIYVEVTRTEYKDGTITYTDNYQRYLLGNEVFEYINNDIKTIYPNSFAYTDIEIKDNNSAGLTLKECKQKSDIDLYIGLYINIENVSEDEIRATVEQLALKYHKEFNNASIDIGVITIDDEDIKKIELVAEENEGKNYYIKSQKIDDAISQANRETIKYLFDIFVNKIGEIVDHV